MIRLKSKEEIEILKEGGKRHAYILSELKKEIKPGISTADLDKKARALVAEKGDKPAFLNYRPTGVKRPYPASLCVSLNEEIVHGIPSKDRIIREGDIVSIDLGLTHRSLITDSAISVVAGKSSGEKSHKLIEHTKEALYSAIKDAKIGNTIGDIGFQIESIGRKMGYGIPNQLAGHGVGFNVHEDPYVPNFGKKGQGEKLVEGMVLAIEPMFTVGGDEIVFSDDEYTAITADGTLSAHFEHTVAITKDGPIILTK